MRRPLLADDANLPRVPPVLISPAFYLRVRALSGGSGHHAASAVSHRLLQSWKLWDEIVHRSIHAAGLLHSRGWVLAERSTSCRRPGLTGGFFFAVRVQRDGGRLAQHLSLSIDVCPALSPSLVECWAAQAGHVLQPDALVGSTLGDVVDDEEYKHAFSGTGQLLDVPSIARAVPALYLPTQVVSASDGPASASFSSGAGLADAPPVRVFKVMHVSSVSPGLESVPLRSAEWLAAHPRLQAWAYAGQSPAAVFAAEAAVSSVHARGDAMDTTLLGAALSEAPGRKRRREASASVEASPNVSPTPILAADSLAQLLVPQPGGVVVAVNGCRPGAADDTRRLLYGVYQVGLDVDICACYPNPCAHRRLSGRLC